jgi:tetratricopeptide (TPR) repeat protein
LLMRQVVDQAERNLGAEFFEKNEGHFWGTISTRPYMRAKQHLAELLEQMGNLDEAIATYEQMLELNPDDNQAVRYPLLALYLAVGNLDGAGRLLTECNEEAKILGSMAWAKVLERWLAGDTAEAEAALVRARNVNLWVESYILRNKRPEEAPAFYKPGHDSEAQVCASHFHVAWNKHAGFREWLRAHR